MKVCCLFCGIHYLEDDQDMIAYMEKTNDISGWCYECITSNLDYLEENNKIIMVRNNSER